MEEEQEEIAFDDEEINDDNEEIQDKILKVNRPSNRLKTKPPNELSKCSTANCNKYFHL
jgi:hypothetical protein